MTEAATKADLEVTKADLLVSTADLMAAMDNLEAAIEAQTERLTLILGSILMQASLRRGF
jgi:hypothetical protein